jgi:aconitate hydratase
VRAKPLVKTSLSPGSRVVSDYLAASGLQADLDALGFQTVGYGCMTCAGASGPLDAAIASQIETGKLVAASVLSGNRNFEGRTHALARANFLGSPALVVAYACAGTIARDLTREPIALDAQGAPVMLADVWPTDAEIEQVILAHLGPDLYARRYASVFDGDPMWQRLPVRGGLHYDWDAKSTYIRRPPYFDAEAVAEAFGQGNIVDARSLAILGDSITTDHISPVHAIRADSASGAWLASQGVAPSDFNSLLARRGNHDVMIRGTFANDRLVNAMVPGREGGWARHVPSSEVLAMHEAAERYRAEGTPLVVVAGTEYGTGSSRDWAAKGPRLLGVRAVIAESFERIHRSNLVGMGVLPLQFPAGVTRNTLKLTGDETFTITGLDSGLSPRQTLPCEITYPDGRRETIELTSRLDIPREIAWYRAGGILPYVAQSLIARSANASAAA